MAVQTNIRLPSRKRFPVRRVPRPLPVRGRDTASAWNSIKILPIRFRQLGSASSPVQRQTQVKAAWDWNQLYFQFRCESPDVEPLFTRRDSPLFQEECVEIFLRVPGRKDFWEFQGNSGSVIYDAHVPRPEASRLWRRWCRWVAIHTRFKATIERGKSWQATWAIAWHDLAIEPRVGMMLETRLCRVADDGFLSQQELSSWPPAKRSFEEPKTWGALEMLEP